MRAWICLLLAAAACGKEEGKPAGGSLGAVVQELALGTPEQRRKAVYALWNAGDAGKVAAPTLAGALRDGDDYVRTTARRVLERFDAETLGGAIRPLFEGIDDRRAAVRLDVLRILWRMNPMPDPLPEGCLYALAATLRDEDASVRATAASVLANLGGRARPALEELRTLLDDPAREARAWAAQAIGAIDPAEAAEALAAALADPDAEVREAAAMALANEDPRLRSAVPALTKALADAEAKVRIAAANALWSIGSDEALPALAARLESDPEIGVRAAVAGALGGIGRPACVEPLVRALAAPANAERPDTGMRSNALHALGETVGAEESAAAAILPFLEDPEAGLRGAAATALASLGAAGAPAVPRIARLLGDPEPSTRALAASALHRLGDRCEPALDALIGALDGDPASVRGYAAQALAELGPRAAKAADAAVKSFRAHPDLQTRASLLHLLARVGPAAAAHRPFLEECARLGGTLGAGAKFALAATTGEERFVKELERLLPDPAVGSQALFCLMELGGAARPAAKGIEALAATGDMLASAALVAARGASTERLVHEMSREGELYAAQLLGDLGPAALPARPALLRELETDDPSMRAAAADALGRIGLDGPAREALGKLLVSDPWASVRRAARDALAR